MKVEKYVCDSCGKEIEPRGGVVSEEQEVVFEADKAKISIELTISSMSRAQNMKEIEGPAICWECLQMAVAQHAGRSEEVIMEGAVPKS